MPLLYLLFLVCLVVPIAGGVLAHKRGWAVAGGPEAWAAAARARFGGRSGATVMVLLIGYVVTFLVALGFGKLAKALQPSVDWPVFHWVYSRVNPNGHGAFTTLNAKLTNYGLGSNDQLIVLAAAIILAFAYRRRWWLPVGALLIAFFGERYVQRALKHFVNRGHPPTTHGTYPSGGVGRIFAIYAMVVVLVIVISPRLSRAWKAGLWTGVVTAGVVEAYTRVYLSKHWFTDAAFGIIFGALLLLTNATAVYAATGGEEQTAETPTTEDAATSTELASRQRS